MLKMTLAVLAILVSLSTPAQTPPIPATFISNADIQSFIDALPRNQLFRACVKLCVHAAPPCPAMAPFSASNPRYSRDFTVDSGAASTPAISSNPSSS